MVHKLLRDRWEVIAYMVLRAWCGHAHEKLLGYSLAVVSPGFHA
jgi:hypothetical protein